MQHIAYVVHNRAMAYPILSSDSLRTICETRFPDKSQAECARLFQIDHMRLRNYFRQRTINQADALRIAAACGVPMDFLFEFRPQLSSSTAHPDGGERKAHLHATKQRAACETLAHTVFDLGEIPTPELFDDLQLCFSKVNHDDKKQMHIVQISFLGTAERRSQVLLIRRLKHSYTKGFSILQSTSEPPPRSLAAAERILRSEVETAMPFTLRPLGFAANTLGVEHRYYFYVYEVAFDHPPRDLRLTTDRQDECAFVPVDAWSQQVIDDGTNRVDRLAWNAIAPLTRRVPAPAEAEKPATWLSADGADFFGDD